MPSTQTDRLYGMTTSVAVKPPCRIQTTAAITLSGEQTVNGVAIVTGDRVLVKDQTDTTTNGIYIADTSAWSRAPDFDGSLDAVDGSLVLVQGASGSVIYELAATNPVVIGTSALAFSTTTFIATAFGSSWVAAANAAAARVLLGFSTFFSSLIAAADAAAFRVLIGAGTADAPVNTNITSKGNNTSTIYTTGGTPTAFTITPVPAYTAYAAGMSFFVNFNAASGASPTFAINGIATPPNLVCENGDGTFSNLIANAIPINHRSRVTLISTTQALVEDMPPAYSMVRLNTANGYGSTNTKIRRFTTVVTNQGGDITYADSATLGATFTINANGVYAVSITESFTGGDITGISLNSNQLTTDIRTITVANVIASNGAVGANIPVTCGAALYLLEGDVIRVHTSGAAAGTVAAVFTMTRVG